MPLNVPNETGALSAALDLNEDAHSSDPDTGLAAAVSQPAVARVNVLGVGVSAINMRTFAQAVDIAIREKKKGYICVTGVHGVMEAQQNPEFRRVLNQAFLCTPDGMPLVWMSKLRGQRAVSRVYGPDLMLELCRISEQTGYRHFLYGGWNGAAVELKEKLLARFPKLQITGTFEPPFRALSPQEEAELVKAVQIAAPDIVWVGISTPKQEMFMAKYLNRLHTTLMIGVGAAFDIHSERVKQAPVWMQRNGLEWFFRFCQEPKRLWRRYLKNNPRFVGLILAQVFGLKRFDLE